MGKGETMKKTAEEISLQSEDYWPMDKNLKRIKMGDKIKTASGNIGEIIGINSAGYVTVLFDDGERYFPCSGYLEVLK